MNWSSFPEYDAIIRDGVTAGETAAGIAATLLEQYGVVVSSDQVSGRIRRLGVRPTPPPPATPEERFAASVEAERARAADRALAREMASAVKGQARWAEFLDIVEGELARVPSPVIPVTLDFPVGSGTPEIFTQLVGDIHVGKLVDPGVVGEGFGYGGLIFQQRWARLENRILRLFALHSATAPFESFRLHFLGDGVDGTDMRRGHAHRVDIQTATQQVLVLVFAFEALLRRLALLGIPVDLIWDYGNHGRVGEFGVNLPADNWDYIAGEMLKIAVRDLEGVKVHVATQKYHITQLGPYRVHSSHGDAVKGGDGFAGLPINGLARALAKDTGLHKQLFDLYLTAHFHTPQRLTTQAGLIVMNGAWDGGDDYSINQLKAASEPVQLAFGIHPERGMTWEQPIHLAPARRSPTAVEAI